jgi:hypothetical protein
MNHGATTHNSHLRPSGGRSRLLSVLHRHPFRNSALGIVGALAVCVAILAITGFGVASPSAGGYPAGSDGSANIALRSVSASRLAQDGLFLEVPSAAIADTAISQAQAQSVVAHAFPGTTVREAALVKVHDAGMPLVNEHNFWVVSIAGFQAPSAGPPPGGGLSTSFALAFVDYRTGHLIFVRYGT